MKSTSASNDRASGRRDSFIATEADGNDRFRVIETGSGLRSFPLNDVLQKGASFQKLYLKFTI